MYTKFDYYNLCSKPNPPKETKLQKYLRLKNEHIMEKCFNIKKENRIVESNQEPLQHHLDETNQEKLPDQSSEAGNVILLTETAETQHERDLLQTDKSQQPVLANGSDTSSKADKARIPTPNKRLVAATKTSTSSEQSLNSNTFKHNKPPKRSSFTTDWKSPFKSIVTKGLHKRPQSSEFAYDLSRDELKFAGHFSSPMKQASAAERQLLQQGQRRDYLMQRYEHSPVVKYNFPEATSWRIGWLQ